MGCLIRNNSNGSSNTYRIIRDLQYYEMDHLAIVGFLITVIVGAIASSMKPSSIMVKRLELQGK